MKLKRIVTSLNASFEGFVNSVENHEAVARSVIQDVQRAAARLRTQQHRAQRRTDQLEAQQRKLQTQRDCWHTRASTRSVSNPDQALQCLKRRDQTDTQLDGVNRQLSEHQALSEQITHNLERLEQRLAELQNRRSALSSREATSSALANARTRETDNIDGLFDRWEETVIQQEYQGESGYATGLGSVDHNSDPFAEAFDTQERDAQLRAELEALQQSRQQDE